MTEADAWERMRSEFERPPETLRDFELWLLHRAQRPEEFEDAKLCGAAWHLTKQYRSSLSAKGGA